MDAGQVAWRRERGAECHLRRLRNFVCEELACERYVYLAAVDIDGAFGCVPRRGPLATPERLYATSFPAEGAPRAAGASPRAAPRKGGRNFLYPGSCTLIFF